MRGIINRGLKQSAAWWYLTSVLIFWGSTAVFILVDFIGDRWFGVELTRFPTPIFGDILVILLVIMQLVAAAALVIGALKMVVGCNAYKGAVYLFLTAIAGCATFVAYLLLGLWYHIVFMGRST